MLKLLGRPSSINVRKVLWTLAEVGLPFEHDPAWATPEKPTTSPEFLRLNPNALVPVIEDEGLVLWESNTICRYLATKHGATGLLPAEARARAQVEKWMDWQATELNGAWRYAFMSRVRKVPGFTDEGRAEKSFQAWTARMRIMDDQLAATGAYAAGDDFTLADVVLGLSAHRYRRTPGDHPALPHVERYLDRLSTRPGFRDNARPDVP